MYSNDEWLVGKVWNTEDLSSHAQNYQKMLSERQGEEVISRMTDSDPHALLPRDQGEILVQLKTENHSLRQEIIQSSTRPEETQSLLQESQQQIQVIMLIYGLILCN